MTEKDLLAYQRCQREIKRLRARYKEEEERMLCPRSPNMDGMPRGNGSDDPFLDILDRRKKLKEELDRIIEDRVIAERKLDRAYSILSDELARDVFILLYRDGKSVADIADRLTYSTSHIYTVRREILMEIATL
jgi:DNA-directed RNA polymerase specialized sigma subunit